MSYEEFFHLKDAPFRLTPDPDYFFPSGGHKEALDTMVYSIRSGEGFVMITGTPGVGKTLLVRKLLRELGDKVNLGLVLNPTISPRELLAVILDDLGISTMEESQNISKEMLLRSFRDYLLAKSALGMKTIIIIDEAQNLPKDTLEELRMLSNLESDKEKLLQIILVGQLELEERLQYKDMKQLAQRITIRYRLKPLAPEETGAYVRHRLEVAGDAMSVRFMPRVMARIHELSSGIPRRINLICERALMAAYVDGEKSVSRKHLVRAIRSIEGNEDKISTVPGWLLPVLGGAAVIVAALWVALQYNSGTPQKADTAQEKTVAQVEKPAKLVAEGTDLKSVPKLKKPQGSDVQQPAAINKSDIQANARVLPAQPPAAVVAPEPTAQAPTTAGANFKSVPKDQVTTTPPTSNAEAPVLRKPPGQFVQYLDEKADPSLLPANEFFLSVDRDNNRARLWQGSTAGPLAQYDFQLDWRIMEGLYILGNDKEKGAFIFNPILFQWGGYNMLNAATLWAQVDDYVVEDLLPVVVYSGGATGQEVLTGDIPAIREIINQWAQAWRDRDITTLMSFYGRSFTSYSIDTSEPETYSLAQLSEIRGRILATSSYISLSTSKPIILRDPQNQDMAIAVFRQEYVSSSYKDEGVKVLYLRREGSYPGRPWKITAKFFLPK
ncbi:MAG: AAA family ATPase, partial [Desulfobulbales bacterium]|nr:AAA family ATPase [Desulfobulbales bacterium]